MKVIAICFICGSQKSVPFRKCPTCGLDPVLSTDDLAKSLILSINHVNEDGKPNLTPQQLIDIGVAIRGGEKHAFNPKVIELLVPEVAPFVGGVEAVPWYKVALFSLIFLAMPIVALIIFLCKKSS